MKKLLLSIVLAVAFGNVIAQSVGDYRTTSSVTSLGSTTGWQVYDGAGWQTATMTAQGNGVSGNGGITQSATTTSSSTTVVLKATNKIIRAGQYVSGTGITAGTTVSSVSSVLSTTGDVTNSTNTVTNVASITGITNGMIISGAGIPSGTTVSSTSGSGPYTITMSTTSNGSISGTAITINPQVILSANATSTATNTLTFTDSYTVNCGFTNGSTSVTLANANTLLTSGMAIAVTGATGSTISNLTSSGFTISSAFTGTTNASLSSTFYTPQATASFTSGSNTISLASANSLVKVGMEVTATSSIIAGTYVTSVNGTTIGISTPTTSAMSSGVGIVFGYNVIPNMYINHSVPTSSTNANNTRQSTIGNVYVNDQNSSNAGTGAAYTNATFTIGGVNSGGSDFQCSTVTVAGSAKLSTTNAGVNANLNTFEIYGGIGGNVINNNGTIDFTTITGGSAVTNITFTTPGNTTVSSGNTVKFNNITLNMGGSLSNTLTMSAVFSMATAVTTQTLTITSGTLNITSASNITPYGSSAATITSATGGLTINNASAVINAVATTGSGGGTISHTSNGTFTLTQGTVSMGAYNSAGAAGLALFATAATGTTNIQGGTLNVYGVFNNLGNTYISGGTINIPIGGALSQASMAVFKSGGAIYSQTGGNINIYSTNANPGYREYYVSSASTTISGGTVTFGGAAALQTYNAATFYNLTIGDGTNTSTLTSGNSITVNGNLTVNDKGTLSHGAYIFTVTGTTTIGGGASGNLTLSNSTGAKTFSGLITVNANGSWNNSGNSTVAINGGGITNNGTFTAGSGAYTFSTGTIQALSGTLSIPSVTVTSPTVLTNNGTLTVGTALIGTGGLTQGSSAILNIGGTSTLTTLTATASGNTVNYNASGTQTVNGTATYYNLTLSGTSAKTLASTTTSITNNLSIQGTASATTVVGLSIGGNLSVGDGTAAGFTAAGYDLTVNGTTSLANASTLTISSSTGAKIFTGLVTLNGGSTWTNSGNSAVALNGGLTIGGASVTFTPGTQTTTITGALTTNGALSLVAGTVSLSGTSSIAGSTAPTFNNLSLATSAAVTASTNFTVSATLTINTSASLDMSTNNLLGATTITNSGTLKTSSTGSTPFPSGKTIAGTVQFAATGGGQTIPTGTYTTLTLLNGSGTNTSSGGAVNATTLNTTANGTWDLGTTATLGGTLSTINHNGTIKTAVLTSTSTAPTSTKDFTAGGTATGTVEFYGSGNQSLPNNSSTKFYNLIIRSGSTSTAVNNGSSLTVNGTLTIEGTMDMGTSSLYLVNDVLGTGTFKTQNSSTAITTGKTWAGTVMYNSTSTQTVIAGNYNNLDLTAASSGNRTLINGGTIAIAGTFTPSATGTHTVTGNTISFNGSSLQTIPSLTYNNLTLNNASGVTLAGDVTLTGDYTVGASTSVNNNTKAIFFTAATGNQTVTKTGGGTVYFDYLVINKATSGNVVVSSSPATDVVINTTAGNVLQLINTGGLDLNGRSITLNNSGGYIYVNGNRSITSTVSGGKIEINQYKAVANNSGTGALTINQNVTVDLNSNGNFDFGKSGSTYLTTLNGTLSINSTTSCFVNTNSPIFGAGSRLVYNQGGGSGSAYGQGLEWPATSGPSSVSLINNSWVNLQGDRSLNGDLTVTNGTLKASGGTMRTLTMSNTGTQTITISTATGGAIVGTDNGFGNDLKLNIGSNSITTLTGDATTTGDEEKKFYQVNVNTGGTLALSRGILCKYGTFTVNGTLQINSNGYVQSINGVSAAYSSGNLVYNNGGSYTSTDKEWPTSSYPTNVTIQNSGTNVVLNNSKTIAGDLTIATGTTLDLGAYTANRGTSGGTLTVAGTLNLGGTSGGQTGSNFPTNYSTVTLTGGTVNYNKTTGGQTIYSTPTYATLAVGNTSGTQTIDANMSLPNLVINASASLSVAANKHLSVTGSMTNNGILNLLSTSTGTATILTPATITGSGTATVQQYLPASRNWYVSSPVTGATTPAGYTVYQYREPGDNTGYTGLATAYWESIAQGTTFENGRGYIALPATGPTTLTFTGSLNTGNVTTGSLTRTTGASKLGFNLVGNPYAAYLNLETMDTTNILSSYWLRSRNSGDTGYDFDTYNLKSGLGISKSGKSITGYIPPMQAFWIRVKDGKSPTTLSFSNAMCGHSNTSNNLFRAPSASNVIQQVLNLQVSNGLNMDETILAFNPKASNGPDAYDSPKMAINAVSIPEIFTVVSGEQVAINGMNSIPYDTEIPLGFTTGQAGANFSIKASQISNFDPSVSIYLKDYSDLINTPVQLTADAAYTFSSGITTNNTSRFALIFKSSSIATGFNGNDIQNVWISVNGTNQVVVNGNSGESSVSIYNTIGQKLYSKTLSYGSTTLNTPLQPGVYLVSVTSGGKTITKKVIID
ncbi:MAG: T9SS type A sorting domain-containing protein [Paludibacter sp.]